MSFLSFVILYFLIGLIAFGILYIYDDDLFSVRSKDESDQIIVYMIWVVCLVLYLSRIFIHWYTKLLEYVYERKNNLKK